MEEIKAAEIRVLIAADHWARETMREDRSLKNVETKLLDAVLYYLKIVKEAREKKGWYNKVWKSFNPKDIPDKGVHGRWHPALDLGVKRSKYKIPDYINVKEMMKDLGM